MTAPRALDLFCGAGGVSVGLQRAGFEVVGVDHRPMLHYRGGTFVEADALTYPLDGFDFVWASPPCQAYSSLRHLNADREYPDLIPATRARLVESGVPYCIENVEGAPLGASGFLIMLCGTMFGLQTPDGRAELRRHRLFETSWPIALRPACQHGNYGGESLSVSGTGMGPGNRGKEAHMRRRRAISVVGKKGLPGLSDARKRRVITVDRGGVNSVNTPPKGMTRRQARETFTADDARAAMGIDWMPMKYLSQAIPPAYAEWIGRQALVAIDT
jgi:DNA (cytosine-5)-methyltransferase 1